MFVGNIKTVTGADNNSEDSDAGVGYDFHGIYLHIRSISAIRDLPSASE